MNDVIKFATFMTTAPLVLATFLLTLPFSIAKIAGFTDFSWWHATSPTWVPLAMLAAGAVAITAGLAVVIFVGYLITEITHRQR